MIELTTTKRAGLLVMPSELLLDHGLVEPTEAERAAAEEAAAESRRRAEARAEVLAAARERLAGIVDPVARAVLDLHVEDEHGDCLGDDIEGYEAERPEWPCSTVETIAELHDIPLNAPPL